VAHRNTSEKRYPQKVFWNMENEAEFSGRILRNGWSGLSESNRHLNLGKVPYYHYTKAALLLFFL
jgi:hypothetical protein